ncbi:hypothetical protein SHINM13_16140 [Flavobacterium ammonificans]|nr:hypothetical protein SHINM13_16140 [Flavobacterium ammonificans]
MYLLSINVPAPIATAKTINKTAIKRVENKIELTFLSISKELYFSISGTKVLKNVDFHNPTVVN